VNRLRKVDGLAGPGGTLHKASLKGEESLLPVPPVVTTNSALCPLGETGDGGLELSSPGSVPNSHSKFRKQREI
jgi:hypothetical protein